MIRDDWLLRTLRQAISALARIRSGEVAAEQMVPGTLLALTGMAPRLLERLPPDALLDMLRAKPDGTATAFLAGALLEAQPTTQHRRLQALTLLAATGPQLTSPPVDPGPLIESLLAELESIPPTSHRHLFGWFVHAGELDRADDHLHAAMNVPGVINYAQATLEPLRDWSADRLAAAGWTHAELDDVLRELTFNT